MDLVVVVDHFQCRFFGIGHILGSIFSPKKNLCIIGVHPW